jgi:fumarate hydratase class I
VQPPVEEAKLSTELVLPLDHAKLLELSAGTRVTITGTLIAAGREVHRQILAGTAIPSDLPEGALPDGTLVIHTRPALVRKGRRWGVTSVEPEISLAYEKAITHWLSIKSARGFIGFGGFSDESLPLFRRFSGVYLQTHAGAGPALAEHVVEAREIPFGEGLKGSDALWALDVKGFPAIVTMDLHGCSLHRLIEEGSARHLAAAGV